MVFIIFLVKLALLDVEVRSLALLIQIFQAAGIHVSVLILFVLLLLRVLLSLLGLYQLRSQLSDILGVQNHPSIHIDDLPLMLHTLRLLLVRAVSVVSAAPAALLLDIFLLLLLPLLVVLRVRGPV